MKPCELLDRLVYIAQEASAVPHFNSELPEDRLFSLIAFAEAVVDNAPMTDVAVRDTTSLFYLMGFEAGHNYALKHGSLVEETYEPVE